MLAALLDFWGQKKRQFGFNMNICWETLSFNQPEQNSFRVSQLANWLKWKGSATVTKKQILVWVEMNNQANQYYQLTPKLFFLLLLYT